MDRFSRRAFLRRCALAGTGWAVGGASLSRLLSAEGTGGAEESWSFFIIADTHYLARRDSPEMIDTESLELNDRLIETLNELPGRNLPANIGGGRVGTPRGVIHLGDVVDTGDKFGGVNERMTDTEWQYYVERYGLTGKEGKLRYPVYELHGNHDSPRQHNAPIKGIIERNPNRPGVTNISDNGLHYSWDWGAIHFVALGNVVGPNDDNRPIGRYESFQSLPFLISDLENHVGNSGRPVVLLQHSDLHRYAVPCDTSQEAGSHEMCCEGMERIAWCSSGCERPTGILRTEWSACDVAAYHNAIRPYNIAAIFHGHLHSRRTDRWDGLRMDAETGIPVFGSNNSGAGGANRAFFHCRINGERLEVREYHSIGERGWDEEQAQVEWTPQVWSVPLAAGRT